MAQDLLDWKTRRALSEDPKAGKEALAAAGREFLASDRLADAAEFFSRAGDVEGLGLIKRQAVDEGNLFVYQTACKLLGQAPDRRELTALADKAASMGLSAYEASARRLLA
jgi:hypothetical protein